jgi:hypothetical protein
MQAFIQWTLRLPIIHHDMNLLKKSILEDPIGSLIEIGIYTIYHDLLHALNRKYTSI